jgi:hypothetical protein
MRSVFGFGETVEGYPVRVLNEREVRAGAGVLFLFAMIVFMNAWFEGNFTPIKLFIVAFFIDFFIRVLISPAYSPSLLIGRFFVRNQEVEYVGAPQKRFAWAIGLGLASFMLVWLVGFGMMGPLNLVVCLLCLTFLFFESAFGICIGCKIYPMVTGTDPVLCAGGVCTPKMRGSMQRFTPIQVLVLVVFSVLIIGIGASGVVAEEGPTASSLTRSSEDADGCEVPQWAIDIGHENLYRLHHDC